MKGIAMFTRAKLLGIVRHVLTIIGGYLVGTGVIDEGTMLELVGAAMAIIGVVASVIAKEKSAPAQEVLKQSGLN